MESDKSKDTSVLVSNVKEQTAVEPSEVIAVTENTTRQQKKSVAGASTQMQLLQLAKQFALDGAMVATDKRIPLEDRSRKRERLEQLRKQQNMEVIIQKALSYCSDNEIASRTEPDWFNSFIHLAEEISNPSMQDLWAKILAGEVSQPNSYSLKALKIFRSMSINDAKLLAKACSLAIKDQTRKNIRLLSGS